MPRKARITAIGLPHHIVHRGNNRTNIFLDRRDREFYLSLLEKHLRETANALLAYCLMRSHVHLLLVPRTKHSLSKLLHKISFMYTRSINKKYMRSGRLWEGRYYSSIVQTDRYLLTVARYIERNPVRAGIVAQPQEYEWSSARINLALETSTFVEPLFTQYTTLSIYQNFLQSAEHEKDLTLIRTSNKRGGIIGEIGFLGTGTGACPQKGTCP